MKSNLLQTEKKWLTFKHGLRPCCWRSKRKDVGWQTSSSASCSSTQNLQRRGICWCREIAARQGRRRVGGRWKRQQLVASDSRLFDAAGRAGNNLRPVAHPSPLPKAVCRPCGGSKTSMIKRWWKIYFGARVICLHSYTALIEKLCSCPILDNNFNWIHLIFQMAFS